GWGAHNNGYMLSTATGFDANPTLVISIMPDKGGLPGLWGGSPDDFKWTDGDNISCALNGAISLDVPADMEVALAVENRQTGETRYVQAKTFKNSREFYVGGFTFSDVVPDGSYSLYPVSRVVGNPQWERVCFADNCSNHVDVEISNGKKTYTNVGIGGVPDENVVEIAGVYYMIENEEAKVTARNNRGNCYSGDVVIPEEVEYQGKMIPVTAIGENAFKDSWDVNSLLIGKNVRELEFASFASTGIKNLRFAKDSGLKTIGGWAFNSCTIPELRLPYGLENIGMCAFRGDIELLDIPETVSMLPSETVSCTGLKDVYVHWKDETKLPEYNEWTISVNVGGVTLHVPTGCVSLYQGHPLWRSFGIIKEYADSGVKDMIVDESKREVYVKDGRVFFESPDENAVGHVYSSQGIAIGEIHSGDSLPLGSGIFIVRIGKRSIKVFI
ncbi:MAG: leucine-rich repeat domain-containing protein, partial [Muribaculaceae bacterium]|nr:leucine-rich repeat domain-containing protein [Muribaculaceae bacterium]